MAINFPDSPSLNEIFADATTGFTYQWNGTVWVNYNVSTPAKIQELDDISGSFNGSTQTFSLTVSSGAVTPVKPDQLIINIGGVAQNPGVDYTLSGSNITFTTAPTAGLSFYGVLLGGSTSITSVASGTVRPDSFTTGGPTWNTGGDLKVTGVTTIANTGSASTALYVSGNARITGIVTVGSSSITIDGTNNSIKVGTGATLNASGITVGIITGKFYGNGSGLSNVGVGTTGSINTSGIVTASSFYGDGSGLTNLGGPLSVLTYQPSIGSTNVGLTTNIILTFNKPIKANTGTITLRTDSASGTIVESYDVTSSSNLSINGGALTIDPTSSLSGLTTYFVVVPASAYKDDFESSSSAVVNTYSFTTQQLNYELWAWGGADTGMLGQNNSIPGYSSPVQIPGTQWRTVITGQFSSFAFKTDNTLWAWGQNNSGLLGLNDRVLQSSPVQIPGTQWNDLTSNTGSTIATKTDGTLWAWGSNTTYGQLGQNDVVPRSSPTQIPGTQWNKVAHGFNITGVTKTDGTLWMIGRDQFGDMGVDTSNIPRSSPIQVPGTQWNNINFGYRALLASKTDNTLWAWGYNSSGNLGQNNVIHYSSPRQIPGTQWGQISCGTYSASALKTDGTLWYWGSNSSGAAGKDLSPGSVGYYSSPIQIPGTQWSRTELGQYGSSALKTDGTLWSWGYNGFGQGGQNNLVNYSSPRQIPGTQWYTFDNILFHMLAIKQIIP